MGQGCKAVKSNTDVLFKINLGWLCSLCTPICWENRQTDSANCRPFRLSPVFVILKRLASFFITCAILRYTDAVNIVCTVSAVLLCPLGYLLNRSRIYGVWCRWPGSNRYGNFFPRDFKSRASASSATSAYLSTTYEIIPYFLTLVKTFVRKKIKKASLFL